MWLWQKQFAEGTKALLTTVTALAISPDGSKLACHGSTEAMQSTSAAEFSYLFVLNANDGGIVSGGLFELKKNKDYEIRSQAFLIENEGQVFMGIGKRDQA